MSKKGVGMRRCVCCREMRLKSELLRVVKIDGKVRDGAKKPEVFFDKTQKSSGRGAYMCKNLDCFDTARKKRSLERALSCKVPEDVYLNLKERLI